MKATFSADGTSFTLEGAAWSNSYPAGELDRWLAFYKRLRSEHPKALTSYDATIAALEGLVAARNAGG